MSPDGAPGRIVAAWRAGRFDLVLSDYQLVEVARVLDYPKIRRVLHWDAERIEQFIKQLYLRAEVVDVSKRSRVTVQVPRDASDEPILAALVAARAAVLVSGDADLLVLRDHYPIETPAEFVRRL